MFAARKTDNVSSAANYIESVFSTYLYTGNGSTQTITNGIDLSGKGGLVWIKARGTTTPSDHYVEDTARGAGNVLSTNLTDASNNLSNTITSFNSTGFSLGNGARQNPSGILMASWTFRKQAKFFDVVTYTGNGASGARAIAHNLGSAPGCYIVKRTDSTSFWPVYHRMMNGGTNPHNYWMALETTSSQALNTAYFGAAPTSTNFYVADNINANGASYVAYLFAHDAGGFGAAGSDNVISCGSFSANANTTINLGWEPQFILWKNSQGANNWGIADNMRGLDVSGTVALLSPNTTSAELSSASTISINSTGFTWIPSVSGNTYIYIAIRRGPMKTPTSGTSVFSPVARTGTSAAATMTAGFAPDAVFLSNRNRSGTNYNPFYDKLRGNNAILSSNNTGAEQDLSGAITQYTNTGITLGSDAFGNINASGATYINWIFQRAPGFFDVVCYTGTGSATTQTHNLGAAPELLIVKSRDTAVNWVVWASAPTPQQNQYALNLNTAGTWGSSGDKIWGATLTGAPNMTSTTFSLGDYVGVNGSAKTYVAYLFASVTGVSKVGSYTGTGTTLQVDCGFTAGSRFVMIKRTDSAGNWVTFDTARGIVSGNDPALYLNSTAAEVTGIDAIDPDNSGFIVNQETTFNLNVNAATYIYLAIA